MVQKFWNDETFVSLKKRINIFIILSWIHSSSLPSSSSVPYSEVLRRYSSDGFEAVRVALQRDGVTVRSVSIHLEHWTSSPSSPGCFYEENADFVRRKSLRYIRFSNLQLGSSSYSPDIFWSTRHSFFQVHIQKSYGSDSFFRQRLSRWHLSFMTSFSWKSPMRSSYHSSWSSSDYSDLIPGTERIFSVISIHLPHLRYFHRLQTDLSDLGSYIHSSIYRFLFPGRYMPCVRRNSPSSDTCYSNTSSSRSTYSITSFSKKPSHFRITLRNQWCRPGSVEAISA